LPSRPIHLAVLASGGSTTLQNLIDQIAAKTLEAVIDPVIVSRPGAAAVERAAQAGLPCQVIDRRPFADVEAFSEKIFAACDAARVELVCLAGWLCLLKIPPRFAGRVMNIHPALLPGFGGRGMYGLHVHQAVLDQGCKISGCTVHFVDDQYDHGPIILQRACPVAEADTAPTLAQRVFAEERIAYPQAIRLFQQGRLAIDGRRVRISENRA
jgi:phosphoribosylglycinamide formyltransferase 1